MSIALQLAGSLIAICALAWLVGKLKLGNEERIRDEAHARELANEAMSGFEAEKVALDRAGFGALVSDKDDRVMVLRKHGAFFVGRLLDSHAHVRLDRNQLILKTDDRFFGDVTLDLGEHAPQWAASLRRIGKPAHA